MLYILDMYKQVAEISRTPFSIIFSPCKESAFKKEATHWQVPWYCDSTEVILWPTQDVYHKIIYLVTIRNLLTPQLYGKNPFVHVDEQRENLPQIPEFYSDALLYPYFHQISPGMNIVFVWKP